MFKALCWMMVGVNLMCGNWFMAAGLAVNAVVWSIDFDGDEE